MDEFVLATDRMTRKSSWQTRLLSFLSRRFETRLLEIHDSVVERKYTDEDQKIDHPRDRGFELVNTNQEISRIWERHSPEALLTRKSDWPTRLHAYLLSALAKRFEWGRFDCCLFVADAVEAMTGTDLAAPFRGDCSGKEAAACLRQYAKGLPEILHKLQEVPILTAQRGDIVLVRPQRHYSLGIVGLNGKEILHLTEQGLMRLPLRSAVRAWRV